jgi:hypothetical protein
MKIQVCRILKPLSFCLTMETPRAPIGCISLRSYKAGSDEIQQGRRQEEPCSNPTVPSSHKLYCAFKGTTIWA